MILSREKIDIARAKKGMSQEELSKAGKFSSSTLYYARNGKDIAPLAAGRIAAALGVPVEDLLEHQGEA